MTFELILFGYRVFSISLRRYEPELILLDDETELADEDRPPFGFTP